MSKYTTELRYICEQISNYKTSQGYSSVADVISNSREEIFNFDYPIFDENYKEVLETKIIRHFYTREICEETYGLWKLRLEDKMNLIMPYYNQLYKSELLKVEPFVDTQYSITHGGEKSEDIVSLGSKQGSKSGDYSNTKSGSYVDQSQEQGTHFDSEQNNKSKENTGYNLHSETPEGGINGIEILDAEHSVYLSDATKNTGEESEELNKATTGTSQTAGEKTKNGNEMGQGTENESATESYNNSQNNSSKDNYIDIVTGKRGSVSMSKMLKEFRETFLNIDMQIIKELNDLFFILW